MKYEDWHTHNSLCRHAIGTVDQYIKRAIKIDLNLIGFSDHFPYDFLLEHIPALKKLPYRDMAMKLMEVEEYIKSIENLKALYHDKIQIRLGFEIDYFENKEDFLNNQLNKIIGRLDYILSSVHILFGKYGAFLIDDIRAIKHYELYNSIDEIYLEYYQSIQNMINSKKHYIDIITHFDLPKKFDKRAEDKELVMNEVLKTLELVKKRNLSIELNTSGLRRRVKEQYPSKEILQRMFEFDIPVLLGSDAHHPSEIADKFEKMVKLLKRIGYNQLAHYNERKRTFIEI